MSFTVRYSIFMNKENTRFLGLSQLCKCLNSELGYSFTIYDVVYFIRHICIAIGCKNACSHCFSNSPIEITQTTLSGFQRIINEVGQIIYINKQGLSFFHLGASNDPAFVNDYHMYLSAWRRAMPSFQMIKVFTHGWNLYATDQNNEFLKFLCILRKHENIKVVISFDSFSKLAQDNWEKYLQNVARNISLIISCVGKKRVRLEVFYTPERMVCNPKCTLEYWRKKVLANKDYSIQQIISEIDKTELKNECSRVTKGLFTVFYLCGFNASDIIEMSRDCETIFSAGRGKKYFKNSTAETISKGIEIQEKRVLYPLKNYRHKYNGVIINPDGTCQMIDYYGYKPGIVLNNNKPIIPYMSIL